MEPRTQIFGQSIHRILIVFPLGLLATSFLFDVAWVVTAHPRLATTAWWMIVAGVVGGGVAALFGTADWLSLPRGTRAWRIGAWHGGGNLLVAALFALSWALRRDAPEHPEAVAIALSACGVMLTVIAGWLGSHVTDDL